MRVGDAVEHADEDDDAHDLYRGHPGRVIDVHLEVAVSFVNGPSLSMPARYLRPLTDAEYLRRGRRLVEGVHPIDGRRVAGLLARGHEWPDGAEPTGGRTRPVARRQGSADRILRTPSLSTARVVP